MTKFSPDTHEPFMLELLLVTPELYDVWESKKIVTWDKGELSVVSPEGLIKLETMRLSGQDQDDIKQLKSLTDED